MQVRKINLGLMMLNVLLFDAIFISVEWVVVTFSQARNNLPSSTKIAVMIILLFYHIFCCGVNYLQKTSWVPFS